VNTKIKTRIARGLGVVLMGFAMHVFVNSPATAVAGNGQQGNANALCVNGSVIGHDEKPLTDGWEIVATPYESSGLISAKAQKTTSDASGEFSFPKLEVGTWQFEIMLKGAVGDWEPVTPAKFDATMRYGVQSCEIIRFKLRRLIVVEVLKIDDLHNPLPGWTIIAQPAPENKFALPKSQVTGQDGIAKFLLSPGRWIFSEQAPNGVYYEPVIPLGKQALTIAAPGPYAIRFKNRLKPYGCIIVHKKDAPPKGGDQFGLPDWHVKVLRMDGTLAAEGKTDALGNISFGGLPLGPYYVVEELRLGWLPVSPSQVVVELVDDDACEEVTFINEQNPPGFVIIGRKIDTNGKVGLPGWRITATPLKPSDYAPLPETTDGTGRFTFVFPDYDYRVPGASYKVCEEPQDGWLAHTPNCQIVTLPAKPGAPVELKPFENQQVGHQETETGTTCRAWHKIKRGNTWYNVARRYRVRVRALILANSAIHARNRLNAYVGQMLCVP
jgi:hypothetical protein